MKNEGKKFEEDFKNSIDESKIYYYRLRDSASSFGGGNDSTRFSIKNDYDCFIYLSPNYFPFELKSKQNTSVGIQKTKEEKGKDIKLHQIEGLTKASQYEGIYAGLLLNFRSTEHTYWLDIKNFNRFNEGTNKKSINENDVIEYGGLLVPQTLKKVRYRYDIDKMIKMIRRIHNDSAS
ncbi:MAG: Holliday junction resolvase RecU [Tissierellia bacterium]|nr:Holliday junction resolvase RecU [Tissierellia bacterium]